MLEATEEIKKHLNIEDKNKIFDAGKEELNFFLLL